MKRKAAGRVETQLSPSGFIEQHYIGPQTADSVQKAIGSLKTYINKLKIEKKPVLILLDMSRLKITFDAQARMAAVKGMREVHYDRGAFYGPLRVLVLINTLAMVSGVQHKVKAFGERLDAIRWLKGNGGES